MSLTIRSMVLHEMAIFVFGRFDPLAVQKELNMKLHRQAILSFRLLPGIPGFYTSRSRVSLLIRRKRRSHSFGIASAFEVSSFSVRPYSTPLPRARAESETASGWMLHGRFTPPRISPSCPHCLRLWLDRSIRAGEVLAIQPATVCFLSRWARSAPSLAVMYAGFYPAQVVFAHLSVSLLRFRLAGGTYFWFRICSCQAASAAKKAPHRG